MVNSINDCSKNTNNIPCLTARQLCFGLLQAHYLFAKIRKLSHFLLLKIMMVEQFIISYLMKIDLQGTTVAF